jgi:glutaredoxin
MKIKLYTHKGCVNCSKVKASLQRILPEYGLTYSSTILELDIDNAETLAELLMMNTESVPVVVVGETPLAGASVLNEGFLRDVLTANLDSLRERA